MSTVKIMIVDDHQIIRDGITSSLALDQEIQVVAEAACAEEALELLKINSEIDVIVMDINKE